LRGCPRHRGGLCLPKMLVRFIGLIRCHRLLNPAVGMLSNRPCATVAAHLQSIGQRVMSWHAPGKTRVL
jgi:hypothetical protein